MMMMPGGGMMPPPTNGMGGGGGVAAYPMYYMDPSLYPGTAPPPTPPLQEANYQADSGMGQQQQQQPIYSQHAP